MHPPVPSCLLIVLPFFLKTPQEEPEKQHSQTRNNCCFGAYCVAFLVLPVGTYFFLPRSLTVFLFCVRVYIYIYIYVLCCWGEGWGGGGGLNSFLVLWMGSSYGP